jgi:hypothetical protein
MRQELPAGPPVGSAAAPYKFLNYFEEEDQASFAGREDEVQEALAGLTRGRTFVLYGRSGLGKTSLLRAGLFPRLRQRGFRPLLVRLLESPVEDFCAALVTEPRYPELTQSMMSRERHQRVPQLIAEMSAREPLVIVFDQFEEFFVRFRDRPAERAELVALLGRVYRENAANIRLVFSLREDYYAELQDLRAELPDLTEYGLRLTPLTAYGARQAIVRPLQHARVSYEEAFVNRMVDMLAAWNFEPPVLQIVCTELYNDVLARRGVPVNLTREDLERLGGADGIVRGYVHRVTSGLAAERLLLVRVALDALISSEKTRYALRAEDLLSGPVRAGYEEIRAVLEHLTEQGLLRAEHRKGERWFELLHEHLMSIVAAWLSTDVDYVRFHTTHELVATMSQDPQWRTRPDWLLTAAQLKERVDPWKEQLRLDEQQAEFLLRSSVHGQADSVADWAARFDEFGPGRSMQLVLGLLDHPDLPVRRGAAASCGKLRDEKGLLASRCLDLALADPSQEVRGAARSSFVQLARPEELARLRGALEIPEHRELALELLADLLEAGRSLEGVPKHGLRHAGALVRARRLKREQETIRARVVTGMQVGLVTGLVWSISIGLGEMLYWICTVRPELVTQYWPGVLLREVSWLLIDNIPFLFVPWGLYLGYMMARKLANIAAAEGQEVWHSSVLRSKTLLLSCALLHVTVLISTDASTLLAQEAELAMQLEVHRWIVLLVIFLLSILLEWLLTIGLVLLGVRCIRPESKRSVVYVFALLCCAIFALAIDTMLSMAAWGLFHPGALHRMAVGVLSGVAIVASFQTFIIICVLAAERLRLPPRSARATLLARAVVLLWIPVFLFTFFSVHEVSTLPGLGRRYLFVTEVQVTGHIWQHEVDAEYLTLEAPADEFFALSVHEVSNSRTRLFIGGHELTSGMLLISPWNDLTGAVVSQPSVDAPKLEPRSESIRTHYRYLLRREPILEGELGELRTDRWTLAKLPLERVEGGAGQGPLWHVALKDLLSPAQLGQARGVHVLPVLVDIAGLRKGACVGISSFDRSQEGHTETFVLTNREGAGSVPPPTLQTERFVEGVRLLPGKDGAWSLSLTLAQLVESLPQKCQQQAADYMDPTYYYWTLPTPNLYGERPMLLVAVKLY